VVENEQFKDCCIQKHGRFRGPSLLVKGGVSYNCSTDLHVIINGDLTSVHYRDETLQVFVHLYADDVAGTLCLWTKMPVPTRLVLSMSTLRVKEIERMDWPW